MKKIILVFILFFSFNIYAFAQKQEVSLFKCVDGDTAWFTLNHTNIKARFLAIDTPETVNPNKKVDPYGIKASDYTCNSLKSSSLVEIEYDKGSDLKDKYGRHLVWVFLNNELLQSNLVKKGYAEVKYIYGNYLYTDILYKNQEEAKSKKLGIWAEVEGEDENEQSILYAVLLIILGVLSFYYSKNKCKIKVKFKKNS